MRQSRNAPLEPLGPVIPPSTARTALIDRLVNADIAVSLAREHPQAKPKQTPDEVVAQLRGKSTLGLPDAYWALYRQNLETLQSDLLNTESIPLALYVGTYREDLSHVDDATLAKMADDPKALDTDTAAQWNRRQIDRMIQLIRGRELAYRSVINRHMERMASMDRQYDVCARKADCWHPVAKKST